MALTKATVKRSTVAAGDDFLTLQDGSNRLAQAVVTVDANGNPIAYGVNYSSPAPEDSNVIASATGNVGDINVYLDNFTGTAVCAMIFDSATLPANGTAPNWRIPLTAGIGTYWFPTGFNFVNGLVIAFSSTHENLTVTTASEGYIHTRSN